MPRNTGCCLNAKDEFRRHARSDLHPLPDSGGRYPGNTCQGGLGTCALNAEKKRLVGCRIINHSCANWQLQLMLSTTRFDYRVTTEVAKLET